jgi:hypothetical protein
MVWKRQADRRYQAQLKMWQTPYYAVRWARYPLPQNYYRCRVIGLRVTTSFIRRVSLAGTPVLFQGTLEPMQGPLSNGGAIRYIPIISTGLHKFLRL